MGLFADQAIQGAYQWGQFTPLGYLLLLICLLASLAAPLFCAVAIRRTNWDDANAVLAVVMGVTLVASLSIWYVLFAGWLFDYHESNIPSANRVIGFGFISILGSLMAAFAGGVMMNLEWLEKFMFWKNSSQNRGAPRARTVMGARPQVTQSMDAQGQSSPSPNFDIGKTNVGPSTPAAPATPATPASDSKDSPLIREQPVASSPAAPSPTPASGGSQAGTLIQGQPSPVAPATPAPAASSSDRPQARTVAQGQRAPFAPALPATPASSAPSASGSSQAGTVAQGQRAPATPATPAPPAGGGPQAGTVAQGQRAPATPAAPAPLAGGSSQAGTVAQGQRAPATPAAPAPLAGGGPQAGTVAQGQRAPATPAAPAPPAGGGPQAGTVVEGGLPSQRLGAARGPLASDRTEIMSGRFPGLLGGDPGATMAPTADQMGALLHMDVIAGPSRGSSYNLNEGNNVLGRLPSSDVFLDDAMVSRIHAMVRVTDGEMFLVDLGSSGGTRVGDHQIEGQPLLPGETIGLGQSMMTLMAMEGVAASSGGGETMVGTPGKAMALVAQSGPDSGKIFQLREGPNIVGRELGAEVQMSDPQVSRRHAVVSVKEDRVTVSDIGSSYGTTINGQKLTGARLSIGDHVFVGQSELVLTGPGV